MTLGCQYNGSGCGIKFDWFETYIVTGELTDSDKVALSNYIRQNYKQNVF